MKNVALKIAGYFFTFIAIFHVLRLIYKVEVVVSGYVLPLWTSIGGAAITSLLALWMFVVAAKK